MALSQQQPPASIELGPELVEINTENLGFAALKGDRRLKLVPTEWPLDHLPPPSSTLLSVASKRGIVAAAGPDRLVVFSTDTIYAGFKKDPPAGAAHKDVVEDITPEVSIAVPRLSHVAFTSDENYLVISGESEGGIAVYEVDALLHKNTEPAFSIPTEGTPVLVLSPNPQVLPNYIAIVMDGGQLVFADLNIKALVHKSSGGPIFRENVTSVVWSVLGKALLVGLEDGTVVQLAVDGTQMAVIPRPPKLDSSFTVSSVFWPSINQFFIFYDAPPSSSDEDDMPEESRVFSVQTDKKRSSFTFSPFPFNPCFSSISTSRKGLPKWTTLRLKKWEPSLEEMLILSVSNSADTAVVTNSTAPLDPDAVFGQFTLTTLIDNRRAALPATVPDGEVDSLPIGVALDLSSKDKLRRPIPRDEELEESPTPLPSLFMLTHQGLLCGWSVVYDASIQAGKGYSELTALSTEQGATPTPKPQPTAATPASPSPGLGASSTPSFGTSSTLAFGAPSTPSFGKPSAPAFGTSGFSATTPAFGKPSFGAPAAPFGTTTPAFGQSSFSTKASPGTFGGGSAFGAAGALGNKPSPWAAAGGSQAQSSAFTSLAGANSGFAKVGTGGNNTASPFSSFGGNNNGQSAFASVGKDSSKSAFTGLETESKSVFGSTEPSFGSTVTVNSSFGGGSTLSSWANTPAQGSGALFGQQSSFASTQESEGDVDRSRDEATPTPQAPPSQTTNPFGLKSGDFKLTSSFKSDDSAKDNGRKSDEQPTGSFFGNDFASALGSKPTTPATPIKKAEAERKVEDMSTTPKSPPKAAPSGLFGFPAQAPPKAPTSALFGAPSAASAKPTGSTLFGTTSQTPAKNSVSTSFGFGIQTPAKEPAKPIPSPLKSEIVPEDAPLPPDPMTWKPKKAEEETDDEHPPLAGSPAVQVEAPDSEIPSSPLDGEADEGGDLSVEEHEEGESEEEEEEEGTTDGEVSQRSPPEAVRRPRAGWMLSDSVNQSPRIPPAAPTPPVKSAATSRSRDKSRSPSRSPIRPALFLQASKPAASTLFGPSSTPAGLPKSKPIFAPAPIRAQESLRSPSPVRSASTSAIGGKWSQQPPPMSQTALAASFQQQRKPPSPEPEIVNLSDDEDERIRDELASEILPTPHLDSFIAHQDYTGAASKPGIPGQIEALYRDINSMIDTLGLNSRSLAAFIKHHDSPIRQTELGRVELDKAMDGGVDGEWYAKWCLTEIADLGALVTELERSLETGKVHDALGKLNQVARMQREKAKLLTKINEVRRQIVNRKDVSRPEAVRTAPLSKDQALQQRALRNEYAKLLAHLADGEEALVMLKTRLATASAERGQLKAVPTVDAVKKTINKMIAIAERKNNDLVQLEAQLRKVGLTSDSRPAISNEDHFGTPKRSRGMNSSPSVKTPMSKSKMSVSELNRLVQTPEPDEETPSKGYGLFYTPTGSPVQNSLMLADDMADDDMEFLKETRRRRKRVAATLTAAALKRGVKVTKLQGV